MKVHREYVLESSNLFWGVSSETGFPKRMELALSNLCYVKASCQG